MVAHSKDLTPFLLHFLCPSGEIINWVALDREKHAHHQLTVLVTDHGSPRLNATAAVYIAVRDLNDNKPIFPQAALGRVLHAQVGAACPGGCCTPRWVLPAGCAALLRAPPCGGSPNPLRWEMVMVVLQQNRNRPHS